MSETDIKEPSSLSQLETMSDVIRQFGSRVESIKFEYECNGIKESQTITLKSKSCEQ